MIKFIVLLAFVAAASAAVLDRDLLRERDLVRERKEIIPILKSDTESQPDGSYAFSYEGGDGTVREEKGTVINAGDENAFVAMTGSYRYIDAEGQTVEVHYTADEHGFVPTGTIINEAVAKAARAVSLNPKFEEKE